jgi:pyruvate dehydrogenase E2 component (dihydrolipoamide acetyltransferase)
MATEVKMPRLSLTMEVGTIIHWLKAPGDQVEKGEDLAEIETDKVNVTMEAPVSGVLRELLVDVGVEVPCDTPIAVLSAVAGEPLAAVVANGSATAEAGSERVAGAAPAPAAPSAVAGSRPHVNASPAAKHLARQLGVDLTTVTGSGPNGRIGLEDVQIAATAGAVPPAVEASPVTTAGTGDRTVPLSKMRAAIAQRMTAAAAVPQFTVRRRVDLTGALGYRESRASTAGEGRAPGVIDLIHLATIRALGAHPQVNAAFQAGATPDRHAITLHERVSLGIAVAVPDGLLVPVIHDAHTLNLEALTAARVRLQEEARGGRLAAGVLSGATFTVSNLGTMQVDEFTAIVNPPEVAILAVGRMQETLVVRDRAIHIVPMVALTVTADHRALDGAQVAGFLDTLAGALDRLEALT